MSVVVFDNSVVISSCIQLSFGCRQRHPGEICELYIRALEENWIVFSHDLSWREKVLGKILFFGAAATCLAERKVDHGQEGRNNAAKLLRACGGCLGARRR
jgi:hypothetical protein